MIIVDEFLNIKLVKRNGGWRLQTTDKMWQYLNKHQDKLKLDHTKNAVTRYFIENLDQTIGLQGTTIQSLFVTKEQVAYWISQEWI